MKIKVLEKIDKFGDALKAVDMLMKTDVLVGVPDDKAGRNEDEMSNAEIGYINEFGSPAQNIPERPHLMPGISAARDEISARLEKASQAALNGKPQMVYRQLQAAGLIAQRSVRAKVNSGEFVPLSDQTLQERANRGRKGAKAEIASRLIGNDPTTDFAKPLVDTGQYRNSITYVIREK